MFFTVLLAVIFFAAFISHASRKHMRNAVANIPGPYCFPAIGCIHKFFDLHPQNLLQRGTENFFKYGSIMHAWAFHRLVIASSDVELNEQILASQQHIVKQRNYKMLSEWLGSGLLLSDGRKWFSRRKIITPAFHFKILEQFVEVFDQQSSIFLQRLNEKADGVSTFDVYPFVCLVALDIIAETAMGTKVYAQTDKRTQYANAVNSMTKLMAWRFVKLHLNIDIIFTLMYPHLKWRQMKLVKIMHDFTTKVIEERRQTLDATLAAKSHQQPNTSVEDDGIGSKKRMALLDVLLQSTIDGKPLTNEDIREEVDTFMFEGHDTTTSAISFTLHLISRHEAVQKKLFAEVLQVLGDDRERSLTLRDLNELKYTECVIKESLRLYPSVPIIGRQLQEDFKYTHSRIGDGVIPAGAEFVIVLYGMLHNPNIFKNAEEFIPERHEVGGEAASAFSMIPFSAGPRNCIGQKFAMLEMKTIIAKTVREYELLPLGQAVKPELNIVMRSGTGFQLGMKKRL